MPRIGGVEVRTCLKCGSPYCGDGTGYPGRNCSGSSYPQVPTKTSYYGKCHSCYGTGKMLGTEFKCLECKGTGEVEVLKY